MSARLVALLALAAPLTAQSIVYDLQAFSSGSFGTSVDSIGDFDGDGVDDFAVGEPFWDLAFFRDVGRVRVYSGATGGVLFTAEGSSNAGEFGFDLDGGDLNGDGFADLLVTTPNTGLYEVFAGPTGASIASGGIAGNRATHSCAFVGDQNGDGFPDCAFGAPFAINPNTLAVDAGRVRVLDLVLGNPIAEVLGEQPGGRLGFSLDGGADLDGDGDDDLLVGEPGHDPLIGSDNGRVIAYDVSFLQADVIYARIGPLGGELGTSVSVGGDVDGDGAPDVLAGAPFAGGTGEVTVYSGPNATILRSHAGTQADEGFGRAVSFVGDADADGYADYAIGAPAFDNGSGTPFTVPNVGRIELRSGWSGDLRADLTGAVQTGFFGSSVGGGLDVAGDGWSEFVVGEPGFGGGRAVVYTLLDGEAKAADYGPALGGASGDPTLLSTDAPVLGSTMVLSATNPTGATAAATFVYGFGPAQAPFKGGALLVAPPLQTVAVPLPPGTTPVGYFVPSDPMLIDVSVYLQFAYPDATAPKGLALSNGFRLTHGV